MNKVTIKEKIQYIILQIIKILLCVVLMKLLVKYLFLPGILLLSMKDINFIDILSSVISIILFLVVGLPIVKLIYRYISKILFSFLPYYHVKDDDGNDIILGQKQYNNYIKRSKKKHEEEKEQGNKN